MRVLEAVPARVVGGVAEAEVGPEVDDRGAAGDDRRNELRGRPVGERQEDGVGGGQVCVDDVRRRGEMGMDRPDGFVVAAAADETDDLDGGVAVEEPDELRTDVAGGADDGDPDATPGCGFGHGSRPAIRLGRRLEAPAHRRVRPLSGGRHLRKSGWIAVMDA